MEIVCLRCVGQVASIGSPILVALYEINRALREAYAQGIEAHTIGSHSLLVFEGVQFVEAVDELSGEREREREIPLKNSKNVVVVVVVVVAVVLAIG